jgi:hypothetical protein
MHWNLRVAKDLHQLTFATQHCRFNAESLAIGMRQQRQEMVFGPATLERRDYLKDPNLSPWRPQFGLPGE